jgi:hypothetical protein
MGAGTDITQNAPKPQLAKYVLIPCSWLFVLISRLNFDHTIFKTMRKNVTQQNWNVPFRKLLTLLFILVMLGWQEAFAATPVDVTATAGILGPTDYGTLKAAFDAINAGTHQGYITIKLNASTTESSSAVLKASGSGSSNYTAVNIYPTASGVVISGNLQYPLIDLDGADNVTIDGRVNASGANVDLTISNTNLGGDQWHYASTIRFVNGATYNALKYCIIRGSSHDGTSGILSFFTTTSVGNSNNTIDNNEITNAGNNRPYNAIFSNGSNGTPNISDTIRNNKIYDVFNPDWTHTYAINLSENNDGGNAYNSAWAIIGNSFYQTSEYVSATDRNINVIYIYSTAGTNFTISSNYIGGSAPLCGGAPWTKTEGNNSFCAIVLNAGTGTASNIQGNTIKNFDITNTGYYYWSGMYVGSGVVNIGTTAGNCIGSPTGTGSILFKGGSYEITRLTGIHIQSSNTVIVQNNTIGSITIDKADHQYAASFFGIYLQTNSGNYTVTNNTIGSTTTANSINALSESTTDAQTVTGIISEGNAAAVPITISNNVIANLTNNTNNTDANTNGWIYGIAIFRSANIVSGNNIHNLTIANANAASGPTPAGDWRTSSLSAAGIAVAAYNYSQTISGNTIYNVSNSYSNFQGHIAGIYFYAQSTESFVDKNLIYGLSVNAGSTSGNIYGIKIAFGTTTYSNNIISLGGNTATNVYGIYGTNALYTDNNIYDNFYYNTVSIGGNLSQGATNKSYALYSNINFNRRDIRNNIFNNSRSTSGGSSLHYSAYFNYADAYNLTLENNDYYVSGTGGILGYCNGSDVTSLPLVATVDLNSKSVNPKFANATGTNAADYLPSDVTLAAETGTGITTDYSGVTRSTTTPAMGAIEYTVSNKASQTITFNALDNVTYGDADIFPGATASSDLTVSYTSSNTSVATIVSNKIHIIKQGTVKIYADQAGNSTYNAAPQDSQSLIINKKVLTVTGASVTSKVYDGAKTATITGATLSGVVGADVVTLGSATSGTFASANVGTGINVTPAMAISGAASGNYTLTQPTLSGNIATASLSITGISATNKVYDGTTTATLTGGTLTGVVGSDVVTLTTGSGTFADKNIGTAKAVTATGYTLAGADAANYTLAGQPTGLTADVTAKALTVTANNASKTYGDANPAFTVSYNGFAGSESAASLTTAPTATTTATQFSNATTYNIVPAGGVATNYTFTYANGTLTVNKANLDVTANNATRKVGETNPVFTLAYAGFKGTDAFSVLDLLPTASCTANTSSVADDYDIVLSGGSDNNYTLVLHNGKLTISPLTALETSEIAKITVFPNPTTDYFFISNLPVKTIISIYNIQGLLIKNIVGNGSEKVDVNSLPSGVYLLKLSGSEMNRVVRFVKQ